MVYLFGNGVPFLVEYRTPGQRGRPTPAIVFFPIRDPSFVADDAWVEEITRMALERVVGPIASLEIEPYPGTRRPIDPAALREENQS
jgi:hypothetical protein